MTECVHILDHHSYVLSCSDNIPQLVHRTYSLLNVNRVLSDLGLPWLLIVFCHLVLVSILN